MCFKCVCVRVCVCVCVLFMDAPLVVGRLEARELRDRALGHGLVEVHKGGLGLVRVGQLDVERGEPHLFTCVCVYVCV